MHKRINMQALRPRWLGMIENERHRWQRGGGARKRMDDGEIWNQLGDWAEVACIVVGVSQAERKDKVPGCEHFCHECMYSYKHKVNKNNYRILLFILRMRIFSLFFFFICLNVWGDFFLQTAPLGLVEESCSQKSTTSAQLRSKWRVKNGWLAPIQAMSTQQLSLFPFTTSPHYFFALNPQHFVVFHWLCKWGNLAEKKRE